jgi:hypothetical protein
MVVDLQNPRAPKEVGRWWMPGMRKGEPGAPLPRTKTRDGVRMHSAFVSPDRPNRLYAGWIDGGIVILDISDKTKPKLVGQRSWFPVTPGYIGHSFLPIFERGIAVVTQEANQEKCADWPKPIWTVDIHDEAHPKEITQFPYPAGLDEFCKAGRFGAHNIHMNRPKKTSAHLTQTVVAAFQNAGVRVYSIRRSGEAAGDRLLCSRRTTWCDRRRVDQRRVCRREGVDLRRRSRRGRRVHSRV